MRGTFFFLFWAESRLPRRAGPLLASPGDLPTKVSKLANGTCRLVLVKSCRLEAFRIELRSYAVFYTGNYGIKTRKTTKCLAQQLLASYA